MNDELTVRGVLFLPVTITDDLIVRRSLRGRYICPACTNIYSQSFARHHFLKHLEKQHWNCTACDWVGVGPGAHLRRSPNHDNANYNNPDKHRRPEYTIDALRRQAS